MDHLESGEQKQNTTSLRRAPIRRTDRASGIISPWSYETRAETVEFFETFETTATVEAVDTVETIVFSMCLTFVRLRLHVWNYR